MELGFIDFCRLVLRVKNYSTKYEAQFVKFFDILN